jgi:curved DNA-binding protein CbpA
LSASLRTGSDEIDGPTAMNETISAINAAHILMASEDLLEELDRWSAYASAAEDEARYATTQTASQVAVAGRGAAVVRDRVERNNGDLAAQEAYLDEAAADAAVARKRLGERRDSWLHTQLIASEATAAWAEELAISEKQLFGLRSRLRRAIRQHDAVLTGAENRSHSENLYRRIFERGYFHEEPSTRQMQALLSELRVEIAAAEEQAERCGAAFASASKGLDLSNDALAEINKSLRSVDLASDYIEGGRQACQMVRGLVSGQHRSVEDLAKNAGQANTCLEQAVYVLHALSSTYDDAVRHLFDTRSLVVERISSLRDTLPADSQAVR